MNKTFCVVQNFTCAIFSYVIQSKSLLALSVLLFFNTTVTQCQFLSDLYKHKNGITANAIQYKDVDIEPGKEIELANLKGAGLISYFYITDNSNGHFYNGLVLKIYWDGSKEPSVNVPLSDFFGAISGRTIDYESAIMQINHLCYMSYIPMPFANGARVVLANDGDSAYKKLVAYDIDYLKDSSFKSNDMRFHCYWARTNPTKGKHELLNIKGNGHYFGNFLQVTTKSKKYWGEGDTDFMIDGTAVKHTPGTEDEYGACWMFEHKYTYMYSGYIEDSAGENRMYRWYLANPVVFKKELSVMIQNEYVKPGTFYDPSKQQEATDDYRSVAFWYQRGSHAVLLQSYAERIAPSNSIAY